MGRENFVRRTSEVGKKIIKIMQRLLNLDDIRDDDLDSSETSAVLQIHFDSKQDQVILYNPVNVLVQRGSGKEASSINPNDTILEKHISDSV